MNVIIYIVIAIIILGTVIYLAYPKPHIVFVEPETTYVEIRYDPFFQRMSPYDLYARQCKSGQEYLERYRNSLKEFTVEEKKVITSAIAKADTLFKPYPRISGLQWRFVKLGAGLEAGMPHTIGGLIVINETEFERTDDRDLLRTLVHEKIHIYQKHYPEETRTLIHDCWGFEPTLMTNSFVRNNPDADKKIYRFGEEYVAAIYREKDPVNVKDVDMSVEPSKFNYTADTKNVSHPYEIMAHELTLVLIGAEGDNEVLKGTKEWMREWL